MSYRTCAHLKEDGALCQSPALRGKKLCFYHHRDHQRQQYLGRILRQNDPLRPTAPLPKTLTDMQNTLYEIITAVANDGITTRRAGRLLYALQQHATAPRKAVS